jgi:hypothetical protein
MIEYDTYQGASTINRKTLDWKRSSVHHIIEEVVIGIRTNKKRRLKYFNPRKRHLGGGGGSR